jgi:sugar lactone lactonase YvrE
MFAQNIIKIIPVKLISTLLILVALVFITVHIIYGGSEHMPDITTTPLMPVSSLEVVAELDMPPGNMAVSEQGDIFFTFHPEASPEIHVAKWENNQPLPYPNREFNTGISEQGKKLSAYFDAPQGIRIDQQNRLWVLDHANHGLGQPRLFAFDLSSNELVHQYDFPSSLAGLGSHLNDFQVDAKGEYIYIANASILRKKPSVIIYDVLNKKSREVLVQDPSVIAQRFTPVVQGQLMLKMGVFAIRPNIDSIALDRQGEWLYYGATAHQRMFRIKTLDLLNESLSPEQLSKKVQDFAAKTASDGITTDLAGNIYISNADQSSIDRIDAQGQLQTLVKGDILRWPDGFSFGPDGWLYLTNSALHEVIMKSQQHIRQQAPFHIVRFKPGVDGIAGH